MAAAAQQAEEWAVVKRRGRRRPRREVESSRRGLPNPAKQVGVDDTEQFDQHLTMIRGARDSLQKGWCWVGLHRDLGEAFREMGGVPAILVCCGIGGFMGSKGRGAAERGAAGHNLVAAALLLAEHLISLTDEAVTMQFCEPGTTHAESQVLQKLGFQMLQKRDSIACSVAAPTLFFVPHGHEEVGDLLWANWSKEHMTRVAVVGRRLPTLMAEEQEQYGASGWCISKGQSFLQEIPMTKEVTEGVLEGEVSSALSSLSFMWCSHASLELPTIRALLAERPQKRVRELREEEQEEAKKQLQLILGIRAELCESLFWQGLADGMESLVGKLQEVPEVVVCYGLGSFSGDCISGGQGHNARYQVAAALLLRSKLEGLVARAPRESKSGSSRVPMEFFDPVTTRVEQAVLEQLGFEVQSIDREGKHWVSVPTLFFMPHCPMRLYSNLLWANWASLGNLLLLGNSLTLYRDRPLTAEQRLDRSNCVLQLLEASLVEEVPVVLPRQAERCLRDLPHLEGAFNDLALCYFPLEQQEGDLQALLPARPPQYQGPVAPQFNAQ